MIRTFLILILMFTAYFSYAQSFYVDYSSGNNANNGTSTGTAWQTIQYAMDHASPGSTVFIRAGIYFEELEMNVSGTAGNPIVFRNYNSEMVYIDGGNEATTLLYIGSKKYITIYGLYFQNTLGNNSAAVFIEGKCSDIIFRKNVIRNIRWTASAATIPTSNKNANPFVVYGNNATNAITQITVDSNQIYNNITGFSENLTLDGNIDGFVIADNLLYDNTNIGILCAGNYQVSSDPSTDRTRNGVVQNNITHHCVSTYATSAGIYVDGGKDIIVERNKSYANGYGIEIGCEELGFTSGITVRDNIVFDNEVAGIAIGGYNYPSTGQVRNCTIENNTLYKNDRTITGSGEIAITKTINSFFRNNIIYCNSQNVAISSEYNGIQGNTFDYNAYYLPSGTDAELEFNFNSNSYSGLNAFQTATSQEASGIFADPLFTNANIAAPATIDFSLTGGSLCIDAGNPSHVIIDHETDYIHYGRIHNSVIDIGAYESGSIYTSVLWKEKESPFIVYPNPATGVLTIKGKNLYRIKELNLSTEEGIQIISGMTINNISLSGLPEGIYIIDIVMKEEEHFYLKVVKE